MVAAAETSSINAEKDNDTDSDVDIDIIDDDSNINDTKTTTTTTSSTTTNPTPFIERVNTDRLSSNEYYNKQEHQQSLVYANDFVQHLLAIKLPSIVNWFYQQYYYQEAVENQHNNATQHPRRKVLDIGGNNGS